MNQILNNLDSLYDNIISTQKQLDNLDIDYQGKRGVFVNYLREIVDSVRNIQIYHRENQDIYGKCQHIIDFVLKLMLERSF